MKSSYVKNIWGRYLLLILFLNFIIRLIVFNNTTLFNFSDYGAYLNAVDRIGNGQQVKLRGGNFLFAISYIGYFAKYILGNLNYFFWFNCLLGTITTFIVSFLIIKITGKPAAGLITAILLTFYTEFMVFSSVFYTPVIMLFLLSLIILLLYYYFHTGSKIKEMFYLFTLLGVYLLTFLFKPELAYLPLFIILSCIFFIRRKIVVRKNLILSIVLLSGILLVKLSGIYYKEYNNNEVMANDFVFFGHTDYGGDGGEGSFVYQANEERYKKAWDEYVIKNNLNNPTRADRNEFQMNEIKKFITRQPLEWAGLQLTKFFRTFGVVPETSSFKILYTGLMKNKLWFTSIVVAAPVAIILLLFIVFFDFQSLKNLFYVSTVNGTQSGNHSDESGYRPPLTSFRDSGKSGFIYIYLILFIYYITATIFYGHYQERYRLPVMVVFIVPVLGFFIASFNKKHFFDMTSLIIKTVIIALFLTIWIFQAKKAISNEERLKNAIESVADKN